LAEAQANRKLANRRYVIFDKRLGRIQAIHAAALIGISGLGSLLIIPFSLAYGVRSIDVFLFVSLYVLTLLGGTVGFHRLFSHRAFNAPAGVRFVLAILASMSAQGPLGYWVANHRRHHWDSDGALDPHSPHRSGSKQFGRLDGLLHAHFGWAFVPEITNGLRFGKGLASDPVARFVTRTYLVWVIAGLIIPAAIGALWSGGLIGGIAGFLWGGLLRIFCVFNAASLINSVCHVYGKSPYPVPNCSRNVWWLSLVTLGESWHNNHHAFSKSPVFGHRWWQVDIGGLTILLLRSVGLAKDLKIPDKAKLARRSNPVVQRVSAANANNQHGNVHAEVGLSSSPAEGTNF
jgi:stearoyl-CoA desaturase (delta-9 desaturase)